MRSRPFLFYFLVFMVSGRITAQVAPAPDRAEGLGPYPQLIIRGAILINGTGAPPFGPVDIVIEQNKIKAIKNVGSPGVPIDSADRPKLEKGGYELDANGMYVMPGFVDMHGHIGGEEQGADATYVYKLWMAHGVTTIRDPGSGNGIEWVLNEKERSSKNLITAPRIYAYTFFGAGSEISITTADQAR